MKNDLFPFLMGCLIEIKFKPSLIVLIISIFLSITVGIVILYFLFNFLEYSYGLLYHKPLIKHFHLFKKSLAPAQKIILENDFSFYKSLSSNHKRVFEHRVFCFIGDKRFEARGELEINNKMKILISATAIMLTFGYRKYLINSITTIIVYPEIYYSKINKQYHKGEFNPKAATLVLSWKDFLKGWHNENDNINLGIHEMMHAIHLNSLTQHNINALIFKNKYQLITNYLANNKSVRSNLVKSKYFREYAFTNQYEFLAVLVENFIETPKDFKRQFPKIYNALKAMLNFSFLKY